MFNGSMLIGFMNNPWLPVLDEVRFAIENKFDFIEITVEYPEAMPERLLPLCKEVRILLKKGGLGVICHVPWYFHMAHPYPSLRLCYVSETLNVIEVARSLDANKIVIHTEFAEGLPSKYFGENRNEMFRNFSLSLDKIREKANEYGMLIMLENTDDRAATLSELIWLVDSKNIKATLDVGHAFSNYHGDDKALMVFIKTLGNRIGHVHLSDNFGSGDLHLPIGVGRICWQEVLSELKSLGYDKSITLEVHSPDRDYLLMSRDKVLRILRDLGYV
ncbi:MAG: sugar phosphate isomerase/epimerase [Thaumarchaeota archaeon]|jgi:sugar phosphate isomerase/epimerase|nr:sugar phosphate isomerase/epimerase [Candidatus Terraquivivens yellowstonensis]MCL7392367.1 sugar phosphate isomerase/epimerase [Candidatus Terraquivivens yellowstonensis]MCL7397835.1 sugar phosphate isomerase/epimerase [Candidatus Terraquivivens yellowstonensis]MCL7398960.1 sugar phosphate isomerase/epimerase [Candidatus Terraquivivens yellowstonensis]MCL7400540.1 sugar phosphate isomerase/epimerase [Candidatus Terraquivivens yellowstonensis]